jgi:SpoVK/Ycf46/Vps4 family AAA+-type ATPase
VVNICSVILVELDVINVKEIPRAEDGFDDLVLPDGHKDLVEALVKTHAVSSNPNEDSTKDQHNVDIVRGKGKGCIILLHGAPGVGKTSTAECVAAFTGRPLFPVTCGDIGYEADEVEKHLGKNFNLAHRWRCVMLLDEADVFMAKRNKGSDLKRNELVSAFLRVLEYYSGILFLTTNRISAFDDAFKSRLHLSLYYPTLNEERTMKIWRMNLRRTVEGKPGFVVKEAQIKEFAEKNFNALKWNG